MREFTRFLKIEASKDKDKMYAHNNSKAARRTPEQNTQARTAKQAYYSSKWRALLKQCSTSAQRDYCEDVLARVGYIR